MSLFRSALSACVIGNIPNIGSFIERPSIDEYVPKSLQVTLVKEEESLIVIEPPRETEQDDVNDGHLADVDSDVEMEEVV